MALSQPARRPGRQTSPGARARRFDEEATSAASFLRFILVGLLALFVALLVAAASARQVSQRDNALPVLEASVRSLTDPEELAAAHIDTLRARAASQPEGGITVPGFPLDVALSAEEAGTATPAQIADLLVERGALLVYGQGMESLDHTGRQDAGLLSAQGVVKRIDGRLTRDANSTANRMTVVMLAFTVALSVAVVMVYREDRRLRALGIGVLLGGAVGALGCAFLGFLADRVGGSDPFASEVRDIIHTVLDVPERNYAIVGILGVAITGVSLLLRFGREPAEAGAVRGNAPQSPAYDTTDTGDDYDTDEVYDAPDE